jgi:hypothetical protein
VTVVNKSNKPIDLGLTYISVQSRNQEGDHVFDSPTGLNGRLAAIDLSSDSYESDTTTTFEQRDRSS